MGDIRQRRLAETLVSWLYYITFESQEPEDRGGPRDGGFLVSWVLNEIIELIQDAMCVN